MAFRNVQSLLNGLGNLLDSAPNTVATREARLDTINRYYLDTTLAYDWLFLETEADWRVWSDRTGTSTGYTVDVTAGSHVVTVSGQIGVQWSLYNSGQPFWDTEDEDTATQYQINRITGLGATTLYLDRAYEGVTATLTEWAVPGNRFLLPADCGRALRFINRQQQLGPMIVLDRRREEDWLSWQAQGQQGTVYWITDNDAVYYRAPYPGWTATTSTAAGNLDAGATYEYVYTFVLRGIESPPSVPLSVTNGTAGATNQIILDKIEDTQDSGLPTGILKYLYRRQVTASATATIYGPWLYLTSLTESDTTYTDDGTPVPTPNTVLRYQNGRKYMGTKWSPSADQIVRLRYLRAPLRLESDSDAPMWPEAYHDLLLYGAGIDLAIQHGLNNKIPIFEKRLNDMLARMKSTQLIVPDSPTRREMMSVAGGWGQQPWRAGRVVGDFNPTGS